jgi:hypothetical protein
MDEFVPPLGVLVLALLPGALYTWGLEQETGGWGLGASDRLLRFVGSAAIFHAFAAPLTWWLYASFVETGRLGDADLPAWATVLPLFYVVVPSVAGRVVGAAVRRRAAWSRILVGDAPAPRAWDAIFSSGRSGWVRIRLKDSDAGVNGWLLGAFAPAPSTSTSTSGSAGPDSYAAGFPNDQDLYLADTAEVDPATGRFLLDAAGRPRLRGVGVLVRWDEISYLEVTWV